MKIILVLLITRSVHEHMHPNPIPPCPAILIERICAPIRDYGLPVLTAVTLVGIDPDLWPALCPRGSALAFAVRQAEAQFMHTLLKLLFGPSIPGQRVNKAQIRAILERRFPHEWGRLKGGKPATPSPHADCDGTDIHQSKTRFEWPVVEEEVSNDNPPQPEVPIPAPAKQPAAEHPSAAAPHGRSESHTRSHNGVPAAAS